MKKVIYLLLLSLIISCSEQSDFDINKFLDFKFGIKKDNIIKEMQKNEDAKLIDEDTKGLLYFVPKYNNHNTNNIYFIFKNDIFLGGRLVYETDNQDEFNSIFNGHYENYNQTIGKPIYTTNDNYIKYYQWVIYEGSDVILHILASNNKIKKEFIYLQSIRVDSTELSGIEQPINCFSDDIYIYDKLEAGSYGFWDLPLDANKTTIKKLMSERSEALYYKSGSEQLLNYKINAIADNSIKNLDLFFDEEGKYKSTSIDFLHNKGIEGTYNTVLKKLINKFGKPYNELDGSSGDFSKSAHWDIYTLRGRTKLELNGREFRYFTGVEIIYFAH